jgi:hypothetical protein
VKFLFKIWSNYDGFTPAAIPARRLDNGQVELGWDTYIESVDQHSEVWVYFHGRHKFTNGVYIKGAVQRVELPTRKVYLRVREFSTSEPLTDAATSARIAQVVAPRNRQVFVLPEELDVWDACTIATSADSCSARHCRRCQTWQDLPRVQERNLARPEHLSTAVADYVPGFWSVPRRNFIHMQGRRPRPEVRKTSELFYRFKVGDAALAYPLALAISENLRERGLGDFDAIVPVPLSPDKEARGEIHRTRLLANELARLLDVPRRDLLKLTEPVSKKQLRGQRRYSAGLFEFAYRTRLEVSRLAASVGRVVLLDDVCTEGSTLSACAAKLRGVNPTLEIVAATAAQMTVIKAVRHPEELIEQARGAAA